MSDTTSDIFQLVPTTAGIVNESARPLRAPKENHKNSDREEVGTEAEPHTAQSRRMKPEWAGSSLHQRASSRWHSDSKSKSLTKWGQGKKVRVLSDRVPNAVKNSEWWLECRPRLNNKYQPFSSFAGIVSGFQKIKAPKRKVRYWQGVYTRRPKLWLTTGKSNQIHWGFLSLYISRLHLVGAPTRHGGGNQMKRSSYPSLILKYKSFSLKRPHCVSAKFIDCRRRAASSSRVFANFHLPGRGKGNFIGFPPAPVPGRLSL